MPVYPKVIERLRDGGDRLLDAGCCFGYVLRQLATDGAPMTSLVGSDLEQQFLDLGYDLFRDRDTFGGLFVAGDMLSLGSEKEKVGDRDQGENEDTLKTDQLTALNGTFDIVHAASFFHLFSWEDQVRLGERMMRFFRTAHRTISSGEPRLLICRQIGNIAPVSREMLAARGEYRFHHNPTTLQQLWDEIGARTKDKVAGGSGAGRADRPWEAATSSRWYGKGMAPLPDLVCYLSGGVGAYGAVWPKTTVFF